MTARIVRLTRYAQKGQPGAELPQANLLFELGMQGDLHQGGDRQLSLLSKEARRFMDAHGADGLCLSRFKQNILIEGLALGELKSGKRLAMGDAVVRISAHGKRCFEGCMMFERGEPCPLRGGAAFAVVERGGTVRCGDAVSMLS